MRILGLDIGAVSVRAVEFDSSFGRYDVHEYHEVPVPAGGDPLAIAGGLIRSLPRPPDRICATLRSSQTTFRNLELPTKDRKAVAASVGFELDDDLPFSIEDAIYGYAVLQTVGQTSHVHVLATLESNFSQTLEKMKAAGVDPDVITSEAWAYRSLLNRVFQKEPQERPVLLVHIGHSRTVLYVHHQGRPMAAREIPWGGADLSLALSQALGVSLEEADQIKADRGLLTSGPADDPASPENQVAAAMAEPLQALIKEIRQSELTAKALTHQPVERIYLSGKSALLPGLTEYIEQEARAPTQLLRALSGISSSGVSYAEDTDVNFALAAGCGLALLASDKNLVINLRKGQYAKDSGAGMIQWKAIKGPMTGFGIVSASLILSLVVEGAVYRNQLRDANSKLERALKGFFGGQLSASAIRTYLSNPKNLKKQIQAEIDKQRTLALLYAPNERSPVDFMRDLSSSIPKDVVVDLTEFQVGAKAEEAYAERAATQAKLTFLVANPQMAERVASILGGKLDGIERSKMEEVTDPEGQKRWKITFTGTPKEATYGVR
jgi:general secretion pathway protein L